MTEQMLSELTCEYTLQSTGSTTPQTARRGSYDTDQAPRPGRGFDLLRPEPRPLDRDDDGRLEARRPPGPASRLGEQNRGKFDGRAAYSELLVTAFRKASAYLAEDAVIYVRTGSRSETYEATTSALSQVFANHRLAAEDRPYMRPTQTRLFGDHEPKAGEVDLVLRVPLLGIRALVVNVSVARSHAARGDVRSTTGCNGPTRQAERHVAGGAPDAVRPREDIRPV
jgi:hypothetical protein